jgi:hypothetical protein
MLLESKLPPPRSTETASRSVGSKLLSEVRSDIAKLVIYTLSCRQNTRKPSKTLENSNITIILSIILKSLLNYILKFCVYSHYVESLDDEDANNLSQVPSS